MNDAPAIGMIFTEPGFIGEVIGFVSGMMVIDGRLDGEIAAHASDKDELVVVLEGEVRVVIDGRETVLTAGQTMIVPAGTRHHAVAIVPSRAILVS